jgi:nitroreductase
MSDQQNPEILTYLKQRRSELALTMEGDAPNEAELQEILTVASRVPDHGKLVPWRFVIYTASTRAKIGKGLQAIADQIGNDMAKKKYEKCIERFISAPMVIGIISTACEHEKVPVWEQWLCGGAVAMNCLIASQALGFGAQWLTGWLCYDEGALKLLDVAENEKVIGLMHIGRSTAEKHDRDRPDLNKITKTF